MRCGYSVCHWLLICHFIMVSAITESQVKEIKNEFKNSLENLFELLSHNDFKPAAIAEIKTHPFIEYLKLL